MTMTTLLTISTKLLAAVAKWATDDESRPHLEMVLFTGGEFVACDGHRLVRVPHGTKPVEPFGVDRAHILSACSAQRELSRASNTITIENPGGGEVALWLNRGDSPRASSDVCIKAPARNAKDYPAYEKIMPKRGDAPVPTSYTLNPRYLAAIAEVNEASAPGGRHGVEIVAWGGELDAMQFENSEGVRFVVMPMRVK